MPTKANMIRTTQVVGGEYSYKVVVTCIDAGSLPDKLIFLRRIDDVSDPKDDSFFRVVEIGDFTLYPADRNAAVDAGLECWRDVSIIFTYDDVETANQAWKELSARINALVERYEIWRTEYQTVDAGVVIVYPTVDESTRTALVEDFRTKDEALETARDAYQAKLSSCTQHDTELSAVVVRITQVEADLKNYVALQAAVQANHVTYVMIQSTLLSTNATLRQLNNASDASDLQQDGVDQQLTLEQAQLALFLIQNNALANTLSGSIATSVGSLQSRLAAMAQERLSVLSVLNQCAADTKRLEADVTVAQQQRDAALEAVRNVCPDFVP